MRLYYDNKSAINIAHNLVQHHITKHVEVDWHLIKEKLDSGLTCTPYVSTGSQLVDVLTKGLANVRSQEIIIKLGMNNICWRLVQLVTVIYTVVFEDYYSCIHSRISSTVVIYIWVYLCI